MSKEVYTEIEMDIDMTIAEVISLTPEELQNDIHVAIAENNADLLNYILQNYDLTEEQAQMIANS